MSVTAKVTISPGLESALQALKPAAMMEAVAAGMQTAGQLVAGLVTEERLTGAGPFPVAQKKLGVKSGRLRQSVRQSRQRPQVQGTLVTVSIGSRVTYAAAHEFGFSGTVDVQAHQRILKKSKGKRVKKAADRPVVAVKAHKRQVKIPERAPFRTGIAEHMDVFEAEITAAVTRRMRP